MACGARAVIELSVICQLHVHREHVLIFKLDSREALGVVAEGAGVLYIIGEQFMMALGALESAIRIGMRVMGEQHRSAGVGIENPQGKVRLCGWREVSEQSEDQKYSATDQDPGRSLVFLHDFGSAPRIVV
jgi:hypothetical protein